MPKIIRRLAIAAVSLLVFAAIGSLALFHLVQRKIASNERAPHLVLHPEPAVDLVYRTLDGQPEHLASSKGKVVFLDLWGTWCIQCVAEMPTVQKLYDRYRNDPSVQFLIVSRMDSPSTVRRYANRNHLDLPFYTIEDRDIPPSMQLNQFPSTFIYAKDGTLVAKHIAAADWSDPSVFAFIDRLKAQ